ncbi:hypothetical protein FSST1_012208 [Fusarium sambucinum]
MPPIIILDSDDDEDDIGYSPPPNVQTSHLPVPAEAEGTSDSFGRVSRATTSTDPSFFQNIYNEQIDAARGYVPDPTEGSHDQHQHSSSDMTAPTPFKRTVTGLLETSSSSTRDQSNTGGQRMPAGNGPDEWTQASTPGRRKAPTAVMDDMWDVPSSPDERPVKPKIKIKVKRSGAHSESTSDSQRDKESGRRAKTPDSKSERPGDSPSSKRKRRKVDHAEPSFQGSNEVDLISIPFSHDQDGEHHDQSPPTPSMLPPTMPVNEDISFFIAPNPLTDTQRIEYESMQLPSSDSPPQLPFVRQFNIQNIASSSEATNVNTPRSNATYLMSTAPPPPPASLDPPRATIGQATGHRWDSSPDVIAAIDSPPPKKTSRLQEQSTKDDAPEPIDNEFVELHQAEPEQTGLPIIQEIATDSYEPEKMAKPAKAKKSRGRPKKKAAAKPDVILADSLPAPPEVIESVTKPKKKRGRPRKSDAKEESPKLDQSLSTNDASLSGDAMHLEKRAKIEIEETETKDELAEEDEAQVSSENKRSESPALEKPDPNLSTRSISSIDDDTVSKNSDTPRTAKQEKPEKPTISSRSSTPSKGLSSIINKPVYRVGLSKKSRIAPLLKCLRKE